MLSYEMPLVWRNEPSDLLPRETIRMGQLIIPLESGFDLPRRDGLGQRQSLIVYKTSSKNTLFYQIFMIYLKNYRMAEDTVNLDKNY